MALTGGRVVVLLVGVAICRVFRAAASAVGRAGVITARPADEELPVNVDLDETSRLVAALNASTHVLAHQSSDEVVSLDQIAETSTVVDLVHAHSPVRRQNLWW